MSQSKPASERSSPEPSVAIQEKSKDAVHKTQESVSKGLFGIVKIAAKHLPLVIGVYAMGYFNFSIAWIVGIVGISAATEQWRKERLTRMSIARASAMYDDKEVILAKVTDLPSWVSIFFLHVYLKINQFCFIHIHTATGISPSSVHASDIKKKFKTHETVSIFNISLSTRA